MRQIVPDSSPGWEAEDTVCTHRQLVRCQEGGKLAGEGRSASVVLPHVN